MGVGVAGILSSKSARSLNAHSLSNSGLNSRAVSAGKATMRRLGDALKSNAKRGTFGNRPSKLALSIQTILVIAVIGRNGTEKQGDASASKITISRRRRKPAKKSTVQKMNSGRQNSSNAFRKSAPNCHI